MFAPSNRFSTRAHPTRSVCRRSKSALDVAGAANCCFFNFGPSAISAAMGVRTEGRAAWSNSTAATPSCWTEAWQRQSRTRGKLSSAVSISPKRSTRPPLVRTTAPTRSISVNLPVASKDAMSLVRYHWPGPKGGSTQSGQAWRGGSTSRKASRSASPFPKYPRHKLGDFTTTSPDGYGKLDLVKPKSGRSTSRTSISANFGPNCLPSHAIAPHSVAPYDSVKVAHAARHSFRAKAATSSGVGAPPVANDFILSPNRAAISLSPAAPPRPP
mmetsp:Transcript_26316/g.69837  ORF Transcript_26316/g.69837 Transcript_26316/m.69837 type:complete len:271 (+) Transcript_26316:286-1098(+)